jgi:hypothetical protein
VFDEPRFRGESQQFDADVRNLAREELNDAIQSIRVRRTGAARRDDRPAPRPQNPDLIVRRAYEDILDREPDQGGLRLYRSRIIDDGWTEQQVRDALRASPEFREKNTMTPAKAREIVRAAYLAVLEREPDANGAEGYVTRVIRDKWSQADVERALRQSPEFRNRQR